MSISLINRMVFHGYVLVDGVFYEVNGNLIKTPEQAITWLAGLE